MFIRNLYGRLNASWKICFLVVNCQSFLVIDGYLLNFLYFLSLESIGFLVIIPGFVCLFFNIIPDNRMFLSLIIVSRSKG